MRAQGPPSRAPLAFPRALNAFARPSRPLQSGKTKHAIENATRVRIVVADSKVHILGAFSNIQVARDAVCALILGTPPGKVYNSMKSISARMAQKM